MEKLPLDLKKDLLLRLDDKELVKICQLNKEYTDFCNNNQDFWLQRILRIFPYLNIDILKQYKKKRTWSEYYIGDLRKINRFNAEDYLLYGIDDERFDHIMIAIDKGADPNETSELFIFNDRKENYKNLVYLSEFIFKNVKIDIYSELFKLIGELDINGLENVLMTKLKNINIKQLCENVYYKTKIKFQDTFDETDYGNLLITMLFNPDVGLVRKYKEIENQTLSQIAFELIISKIDTPEMLDELYQDFLKDIPGIDKYVSNTLEINSNEEQTVIEALKNINISVSDIKIDNNLTDEEALLVLLIFTRFRKGEYRLNSSWLNVCKNI